MVKSHFHSKASVGYYQYQITGSRSIPVYCCCGKWCQLRLLVKYRLKTNNIGNNYQVTSTVHRQWYTTTSTSNLLQYQDTYALLNFSVVSLQRFVTLCSVHCRIRSTVTSLLSSWKTGVRPFWTSYHRN